MAINTNEYSAMITQAIIKLLPNGLIRSTAFLKYIFEKGLKYQNGGMYLQFPIKLLPNTTSGFKNGTSDLLEISPVQQNVFGTINWKYYFTQVAFTLQDQTVTGGEDEKRNTIEDKTIGALKDAYQEISLALHGSDDPNIVPGSDTRAFTGLQSIINPASYAGLNAADYPGISANYAPYAPIVSTDTTPNYNTINKMINKLRGRMQAMEAFKDVFGFTNPAVYNAILSNLQNQQIFINDKDLFAAGVSTGFKINGIEFYLDSDVPGSQTGASDNFLYILPMNILKFYYKFGLEEKQCPEFSGTVRIPSGMVVSHQHFLVGNLLCNNRRLIAVNKTLAAA
jgi:hypothetical protein